MLLAWRALLVDEDRPATVRVAVRRISRWAVDRPHLHLGVRRGGRGVEGRVLDVVAHQLDALLPERLDVEQCAAVGKPELAVLRAVEAELEVHELRRCADLQLQVLEDGSDLVTFEAQRALHAKRVDRARGHPLVDRELRIGGLAELLRDERQPDPILEVADQQILASQVAERLTREVGELEIGVELAGVGGTQGSGRHRALRAGSR